MGSEHAEDLIPLSPRVFHMLLSLADGARNGYRIMLLVEENSMGRVKIGPGTLYEALHRMRQQGLIEEVGTGEGKRQKADGRGQRFYRLARLGRQVLRLEAQRLASDLQVARLNNLLGEADF